jgi:hypothetical protein
MNLKAYQKMEESGLILLGIRIDIINLIYFVKTNNNVGHDNNLLKI